jgi:hypothetical protein
MLMSTPLMLCERPGSWAMGPCAASIIFDIDELGIGLGSHPGHPYRECIRSTDAKGFWALLNLRWIKLALSGSRCAMEPELRRLLKHEASRKTPFVRDMGENEHEVYETRQPSSPRYPE